MSTDIDFLEVYKEYQPKILRYLSRFVGPNDAEDVAQEVFGKVSRSLESFRSESKLSTWIYRIATNTALDRLKPTSFRRTSEQTTLQDSGEVQDINTWTGRSSTSTDRELIRNEMSECVREYVDKLPSDYSAVMILSELEGFKNREIADILQVSLGIVKIRLHRARKMLKEKLDGGCDFYHNEEGTFACDRRLTSIKLKPSD